MPGPCRSEGGRNIYPRAYIIDFNVRAPIGVKCSLYYKATPSAKIMWPYTAGGLLLEVNFKIQSSVTAEWPYNTGSTVSSALMSGPL